MCGCFKKNSNGGSANISILKWQPNKATHVRHVKKMVARLPPQPTIVEGKDPYRN